jgi:hypothetical protein
MQKDQQDPIQMINRDRQIHKQQALQQIKLLQTHKKLKDLNS